MHHVHIKGARWFVHEQIRSSRQSLRCMGHLAPGHALHDLMIRAELHVYVGMRYMSG